MPRQKKHSLNLYFNFLMNIIDPGKEGQLEIFLEVYVAPSSSNSAAGQNIFFQKHFQISMKKKCNQLKII